MRIIGITGGIACGKSTVTGRLRELGYPVIDGDELSRELTRIGSPLLPEIRKLFGDQVFRPGGELKRRALGRLIFEDPQARQALDDLMAPYLMQLTLNRIDDARDTGMDLCFLDMPLLFEKGYDRLCDATWCLWLPEQIQLRRLMDRDGFTKEEALQRIHSVLSSEEKAERSDQVIDNSGTVSETLDILAKLLEQEKTHTDPQSIPASSARSSQHPESNSPNHLRQYPGFSEPAAETSAEQSEPSGSVSRTAALPDTMERPAGARKKPSERKASWRLPSWLMITLVSVSLLLCAAFTAQCLMQAYLVRRQAQHEAEQRAVDTQYPLLYRDLIEKWSAEYNLEPAYVAAIIRNESSFRAEAVSSVGARGLMQLMPETAEWIAHKIGVEGYAFERMFDPDSNIRFGCWYLRYLSSLFSGDSLCVTCAYHAGQGEIIQWLSNSSISMDGVTLSMETIPEGPTKQYAGRVTRDYGIYLRKYFSEDDHGDPDNDSAVLLPAAGSRFQRGRESGNRYPKFQDALHPSL